MVLTTTLAKIKAASPCESGYKKLVKHLGGVKLYGAKTPINLLTILDSNGVADCLWCLRATTENCDDVARLMAADFAEESLPIYERTYPDDSRPRHAIAAVRGFVAGVITSEQMAAAGAAAWAAAGAAAGDATWATAGAAARDAAGAAARGAAWATAGAAAVERHATIIRKYLE